MQRSREAAKSAVNLPGLHILFREICRDLIGMTGATRGSVWYFEANGSIVCQELLDRRTGKFESGMVIGRDESAPYLDRIVQDGVVACEMARTDPITAGFTPTYFEPNGIHSLLDMVVRDDLGHPAAILCCEQCDAPRAWRESDVVAMHGLTQLVAETFRYRSGTEAQRTLFTPDLPFADEPLLLEAAIYWASIRSSRPMPARSDVSPLDMPRALLPHLVLAELRENPFQVRFRLVGTEMVSRFGRDFTGLAIGDFMRGDYADYISGLFRKVWETSAPVYSESLFKWNDGGFRRTRRLMLPLSLDGGSRAQQVLVVQVWPQNDAVSDSRIAVPVSADTIDNRAVADLKLPVLARRR